ncbi:MAG: hypothetical protein JNK63_08515 [Chthonomonas sp.]|nr:hypothetical protein [Chthonomonas sp.]MCC6687395.1 hypothetical protein [Fimbriimonadaceae bacterium]
MNILLMILAIVVGIASLWCTILVLIDMFQDEIWKGLVGLLCGLYWLYYAIFEYDHENKWIIVLTALAGGAIASLLMSMAT